MTGLNIMYLTISQLLIVELTIAAARRLSIKKRGEALASPLDKTERLRLAPIKAWHNGHCQQALLPIETEYR